MRAGAINFFDLLILVGRYQYKPPLPYTMGSEGAGVIIEVAKDVTNLKVGDEVMLGMIGGTMAEEMVTPASLCIPKPKAFTFPEAASFFVGYSTAYHGLVQRGAFKKGETLLVTGAAGGMGMAAIQLGRQLGASKVIAGVSSQEKAEAVMKLGATHVINYAKEDMKKRVKEICNGEGVDVVYEIVGGDVFNTCVSCLGSGGRLLVIGFAGGTIPSLKANLALVKGISLVGVRAGAEIQAQPHLFQEMVDRLRVWDSEGTAGQLAPVVGSSLGLDRFREAYTLLQSRGAIGKACVLFNQTAPSKL